MIALKRVNYAIILQFMSRGRDGIKEALMTKVLLAGESWFKYITHVKGYDTFYSTHYEEGAGEFIKAVRAEGYELDYMPGHLVPDQFPFTAAEMAEYDLIILSDIGANSLLLSNDTFNLGKVRPNRLKEIERYVEDGGAFLMIGGYLSFSGMEAKGHYAMTAINDILPVRILHTDDRVETPEGIAGTPVAEHAILDGIDGEWPIFLGYNKTILRDDGTAEEIVRVGNDPLIAIRQFGKGRTAVFTSDCAPHWGSPEFMAWPHYARMWGNLIGWLTEK